MNFVSSGKINPKFISAGRRLLFTESICFLEKDGVELKLPAEMEKNELTFQFCFILNRENTQPLIKIDIINNLTIKLTLTNFNNPLGVGTTSPLEFNIGKTQHWLLIYVNGLINEEHPEKNLISMTVSMYREGM